MNPYEHLVGQDFLRNGARHTVVKCVGATVVAAYLENNRVQRILLRLSDVLDALEVTEINITEPAPRQETAPRQEAAPRQVARDLVS